MPTYPLIAGKDVASPFVPQPEQEAAATSCRSQQKAEGYHQERFRWWKGQCAQNSGMGYGAHYSHKQNMLWILLLLAGYRTH